MNDTRGIRLIGLTGPSGSGKGAVASVLASHGFAVIDADAVYHAMLVPPSECLDRIAREFGQQVLDTDGCLDRSALAAIVFKPGNEDRLRALNAITHGFVIERTRELIREYESAGYRFVVFDAPLLIESGFGTECEAIISVLASSSTRVERIMLRDSISKERAQGRIAAQPNDDFYINAADFVIRNDSGLDALSSQVCDILNKLVGEEGR